jgi:hypothetical protein
VKQATYEWLLWVDACVRADEGAGEVDAAAGGLDADGVGVGFGEEGFPVAGFERVVEGEDFAVAGQAEFDGYGVGGQRKGDERFGGRAVLEFDEGDESVGGAADAGVVVVRFVLADGEAGGGAGGCWDLELGGGFEFRVLEAAAEDGGVAGAGEEFGAGREGELGIQFAGPFSALGVRAPPSERIVIQRGERAGWLKSSVHVKLPERGCAGLGTRLAALGEGTM